MADSLVLVKKFTLQNQKLLEINKHQKSNSHQKC